MNHHHHQFVFEGRAMKHKMLRGMNPKKIYDEKRNNEIKETFDTLNWKTRYYI